MTRPFISFLTDFGTDGPAPICRGVMLSIAPDAQIVDIGHNVRKYAIRDGAFLFWCAVPYLPVGVHVGVVDPGVGTDRRPIAILTARGDRFVGPDNGLFMPATERLGGIVEARVLENRALWLPVTSSTFHGRDIFSPVGAHLAMGVDFAEVGPSIPASDLVQLSLPAAHVHDGWLETAVTYIDSFGNARLAGIPDDLASAVGGLSGGRRLVLEVPAGDERSASAGIVAGRAELTWESTFGRVAIGATLLYEDSFGTISAADNQGNLAARLGLTVDQPIRIRPA
ncbi:MAG: S-adenosyl-l-methionine hydroxide adenosyltransferase family protein [Chloroflexota bacterium]